MAFSATHSFSRSRQSKALLYLWNIDWPSSKIPWSTQVPSGYLQFDLKCPFPFWVWLEHLAFHASYKVGDFVAASWAALHLLGKLEPWWRSSTPSYSQWLCMDVNIEQGKHWNRVLKESSTKSSWAPEKQTRGSWSELSPKHQGRQQWQNWSCLTLG